MNTSIIPVIVVLLVLLVVLVMIDRGEKSDALSSESRMRCRQSIEPYRVPSVTYLVLVWRSCKTQSQYQNHSRRIVVQHQGCKQIVEQILPNRAWKRT